jgi:tetratricopeptide (TPR) repeat protein
MRQRFTLALVAVMLITLGATSAWAQAFGKVTGTCKDADGKPIVGATVRYLSKDTGQKFDMKTNGKGEYMSIGVSVAHSYQVILIGADGKEIDKVDNVQVQSGDNQPVDFDVKAQQTQALQQKGMTAEQAKQAQAQLKEKQAAAAKEGDTVKVLNEKLKAATDASKAGDFDNAIALLTEATNLDGTRDVLWYQLGDAYSQSASKQTDAAEKTKRLDTASTNFQKAIDLKKADMAKEGSSGQKPDANAQAEANKRLAAYYNGLGNAYGKAGNTDGAVAAYGQAAQVDPPNGGMYFFNLGAALTNANKTGDAKMAHAAIDAFDKAIASDPTKADAYYWKGSNLMQLATVKGDKMVAPDGTAESFQKYLELKPDGPHAEESKAMLQGMGATIETSYGTKKKAAVKK